MMATPQRPLPGAYMATPAPVRPETTSSRPPAFRLPSNPSLQRQQNGPSQLEVPQIAGGKEPLSELERAANGINQFLTYEARFPAMEDYIPQGASSDYQISSNTPYAPFDKIKSYDIPDKIFETFENSHLSTKLGLFPEIHRAWAAVDNAIYIWDYTHPNPEIAGADDFNSNIVAVELAQPKKDTFRNDVNYVLLVATAKDLHILGVAASTSPQGVTTVELYQTDMKISMSNLATECIASCPTTGRIFVGCSNSNAIYEMQYQKEERWFWSKCGKVNQTFPALLSPQIVSEAFTYAKDAYAYATSSLNQEYSVQIEIDESRQLLYVLSNQSTIRVFHMLPESDYRFFRLITDGSLKLVITKTKEDLMSDIAHIVQRSSLFRGDLQIVSISPVTKAESGRIALVATTSVGIRIYLSVTSGARFFPNPNEVEPPSSMQIHHLKFPPSLQPESPQSQRINSTTNGALVGSNQTEAQGLVQIGAPRLDTESQALKGTTFAARYSPGSHFFFISPTPDTFKVFISTPETGLLGTLRDNPGTVPRFIESGVIFPVTSGKAIDIGLTTPPFFAASTPTGFGNEMAVQFDRPTIEVAVLTNTGVHIYRRRRLVDVFAAVLRTTTTEEDFDSNVKRFIRNYSRIETCASALAVACGQATDTGSESNRSNVITNPEVIELARRTFIEHGGKPDVRDAVENNQSQMDSVRNSARTNALILYTSRLIRSLWKKPILKTAINAGSINYLGSTIPVSKLQKVSQDLTSLKEFLDSNKTFITGLNGPEELSRAASVDEQIAVQAEHRALVSQIQTLSNMIEGIAFLTQLFDQPFAEILASLPPEVRDNFGKLTYDMLFTSSRGKLLAKEVVKAIVNRSIEAGSSVESVADSLRRRCGSFCSQADVITFKAQEKLQKAMDAGAETANGRSLLNESLKLFKQVADSFTAQYLEAVVTQYLSMSFYAGAISLCLDVAHEKDRAKQALAWIKDGRPVNDSRSNEFESRMTCYNQVWRVIQTVDGLSSSDPSLAQRKQEAYGVIDLSEDEIFQNCLYDWYLQQNLAQRLMDLKSPFVIAYLERKAVNEKDAADLLWHYHVHHHQYFEAAKTQLHLAKSLFDIGLEERLDYLSRAKANASTRVPTFGRLGGSKQEMIRTISDLLDCANVQLDLLHRLMTDSRVPEQNRTGVVTALNGPILSLSELYNSYAQPADFFDICLVIYHLSDHMNGPEIIAAWRNMIQDTYRSAVLAKEPDPLLIITEKIRSVALRVNCSEPVFSAPTVLSIVFDHIYSVDPNASLDSIQIPVNMLLDLGLPYEVVLSALTDILFTTALDWSVTKRRTIGSMHLRVSRRWASETSTGIGVPFGSVENAAAVLDALKAMESGGLVLEKDTRALRETVTFIEKAFS